MTLGDLAKRAFGDHFKWSEFDVFCQSEQVAPTELMESFTRLIVEGYVSGLYTWEDCDAAINVFNPFVLKHSQERIPDYPWEVFLAFDAGEYHPKTPDLTPDEVTRPLIEQVVRKYHLG